MLNEITIHKFEKTKSFANIVREYSLLWKDIDFVDLSKKNWIRISLKSNWKQKVIEKAKVYFLSARDRDLVNKTFDEFQD